MRQSYNKEETLSIILRHVVTPKGFGRVYGVAVERKEGASLYVEFKIKLLFF